MGGGCGSTRKLALVDGGCDNTWKLTFMGGSCDNTWKLALMDVSWCLWAYVDDYGRLCAETVTVGRSWCLWA